MHKIVLLIPYFGKKPSYYDLWESTAFKNDSIDFYLITDIHEIRENKNIRVMHMAFDDFRLKVQSCFGFPVKLSYPYKCCDYKPAYGFIFRDIIREYDFWGHCDLDLIFGDIRYFLTEECLDNHDKILEHGHFCLYRNCEKINSLFMEEGPYPEINYKECYQTDDVYAFDEFPGMLQKCRRLGVKLYSDTGVFYDAKVDSKAFVDAFHPNTGKRTVIRYAGGHLYAIELSREMLMQKKYEAVEEREIMYFHFQKRKLNEVENVGQYHDNFYIIPNRLLPVSAEPEALFEVKGGRIYRAAIKWKSEERKMKEHKARFGRMRKEGSVTGLGDYIRQRRRLKRRFRDSRELVRELKRDCSESM